MSDKSEIWKEKVDANDFIELGSGIITLCGSTKFYFETMEASRRLTFNNWMVFMVGSFGHSANKYTNDDSTHDYTTVKKLHFYKIEKSDAIVVVSDDSLYIGDSTRAEIAYAKTMGIPVFYFNGREFFGADYVTKIPMRETDEGIERFLALYKGNSGVYDGKHKRS